MDENVTTSSLAALVPEIYERAMKQRLMNPVFGGIAPPYEPPVPLTTREKLHRLLLSMRSYLLTLGRALRGDVLYTEEEYDDAREW